MVEFEANAIGKRSQTVQCANENSSRMFHSEKEIDRHLRDNHSEPSIQTSYCSKIETDKRIGSIKRIELMFMSVLRLNTCKTASACETGQRIRTGCLSSPTETAILCIKSRH